jgi:hypothetical protein
MTRKSFLEIKQIIKIAKFPTDVFAKNERTEHKRNYLDINQKVINFNLEFHFSLSFKKFHIFSLFLTLLFSLSLPLIFPFFHSFIFYYSIAFSFILALESNLPNFDFFGFPIFVGKLECLKHNKKLSVL